MTVLCLVTIVGIGMMSRDIIVGIGIIQNSISFRKPSDCKQTVDTKVLKKAKGKEQIFFKV